MNFKKDILEKLLFLSKKNMGKALEYARLMSTTSVYKRGEELYNNQAVTEVGYEPSSGNKVFKVQGSFLYTVKIHEVDNKILNTHCSCPYNYHGICKHTVAALLWIDNKGKKIIIEQKAPKKKKAKTTYRHRKYGDEIEIKKPYLLKPEDIEKHFNNEQSLYSLNKNAKLYDQEINDQKIKFYVYLQYQYFTVTIIKKNNKVYISTDEEYRAYENYYRLSEAFVLYVIANSSSPDFLDLIFNKKLESVKKETLNKFGLAENTDFYKYFSFLFHPKKGVFPIKKVESIGLIPVNYNQESPIVKFIQEHTKTNEFVPTLKRKEKRSIGFVLAFDTDDDYNNTDDFDFNIIIGKTDKAGKTISARIEEFITEDLSKYDIKLSNNQKQIIEISNELLKSDEEKSFYLRKLLFELLAKEQLVYWRKFYDRIIKRNLKPVQISKNHAKTYIKIYDEEGFINAELCLNIENNHFQATESQYVQNFGFEIIDNTLYHLDNYSAFTFAKEHLGIFKMPIGYKDAFYNNIIKSLSNVFNIVFDTDIYKTETHVLDFSAKQIFLSEKNNFLIIKPQVVYGDSKPVILSQETNILEKVDDKIIEYQRNFELEEDFINQIAELHPDFEQQKAFKIFYIHYDDFMNKMWFFKFFEQMQQNHIEVYGLKELKNFKYSPYKGKITTSVKSGIDWFDVKIDISFGENKVSLKDIKKAIINKERYILLKDGSVGILPEEWFHKLEKYFRNGEIKKETLKVSKLRFSIIDELFDNIDNEKIHQEISEKRRLLQQFKEIEKVKVPKSIKAELRNYQKEGLNWLNFLKKMKWGGILADDMGLGKTLQILSFLQSAKGKQKKASLIVVPTTLLFNWQKEIEKFAPKLKALYHYGANRANDTEDFDNYDIVFTTYGILLRDIEMLHKHKFQFAILDESQAIKNPASRRYKAAVLLQADNKFALTGTPIENSTFDLYAQMNFVNPGLFASINDFKKSYSNPIDKEGNEMIASELQRIINPFILRRTKEQVATELPPKVEDIIYCEMGEEQRKVYEAFKNSYRDKLLKKIEKDGMAKSKLMVLEALMRLRQICDSPVLLKDEEIDVNESVKIKEIIHHITEKTANHKILIFSQFVEMLSLLRKELDKLMIPYEYLDGKSSSTQREASVNNFQNNNDLRVFLISLKAGGTGLNLTAADYVYILDPWWNPAVENQAIDRCYRIGQDKHVFAYRMICKNTIEEKIMQLQSKKKKIAADIIQTDENIIKNIDINDIKELLG